MENTSKKPMTDVERLELAAKLDEDLDNFINGLEKRQYTEGWPEDRWQEEMEKHPFFMKKFPEPGNELHPLMEGLQQLKYDPNENTPEELTNSYKEDGNFNFKHKNYRLAIIAYTEAIKIKCGNADLEATLYNNRAAANYFLENYRSSLRDCQIALKLKPDYDKVINRAAYCSYKIQQYENCLEYCDKLLTKQKNDEILSLKEKCTTAIKDHNRNLRKQQLKDNNKQKQEKLLMQAILKSGAKIERTQDNITFELLQPQVPQLEDFKVSLNESGKLVWPAIFLYPEYQTMDFIQQFQEDETFISHIESIFQEHAEWDKDNKYKSSALNIYFENPNKTKVVKFNSSSTLSQILADKRYIVRAGTPSFFLLVSNSQAETSFLENYKF